MSAVPVVQRIEQGFPKAKTAFFQQSANVIRSTQTTRPLNFDSRLLCSSVIRDRLIFKCPGDTTGDTKTTSRAFYHGNCLLRAAGATAGIYGNHARRVKKLW